MAASYTFAANQEVVMVPILSLWAPILLSAVLVFLASAVMHMLLPWHRGDYKKLPNEDAVLDAIRKAGVTRGDYSFPRPASMKDMNSPEMQERYKRGPVGMMTLGPTGPPAMSKSLFQWFIYCIVVCIVVAYVAGLVLPAGAEYRIIFRLTSTVAFAGFVLGGWQDPIWRFGSVGTTIRNSIDGLIYALLAAGVFGWLWP
jgi:hypothetical protein